MKCYYHHGTDAVGVCKNCGKGICPDCLTDVGSGIACTNSCAGKMRAKRKRDTTTSIVAGVSLVVVGALFVYRGYVRESQIGLITGIWVIVMGVLSMVRGTKNNNGNS